MEPYWKAPDTSKILNRQNGEVTRVDLMTKSFQWLKKESKAFSIQKFKYILEMYPDKLVQTMDLQILT